jgi:hypothetical protein
VTSWTPLGDGDLVSGTVRVNKTTNEVTHIYTNINGGQSFTILRVEGVDYRFTSQGWKDVPNIKIYDGWANYSVRGTSAVTAGGGTCSDATPHSVAV